MYQRIGTCSSCGGDVMGYRGPWMSVSPPPPDECSKCGSIAEYHSDIIKTVPNPFRLRTKTFIITDTRNNTSTNG